MPPSSRFESSLAPVRAAIALSGREVTVVAVTKGRTLEACRLAAAARLELGENRVQEAQAKVAALPGARWHLVGTLQANKARRAASLFAVVQSVDSAGLAERLGATRPGLEVLVQVRVTDEPAKHGVDPADAEAVAMAALGAGLDVRGVMGIGPRAGDPRPAFAQLARTHLDLQERLGRSLPVLSMGMSDDWEAALAAGSTMLRLGRLLFD